MKTKYRQVFEGDWNPIYMRGQKIGCCDCFLIHRINLRRTRRGMEMQVFRDERATAQKRRYKGVKLVYA